MTLVQVDGMNIAITPHMGPPIWAAIWSWEQQPVVDELDILQASRIEDSQDGLVISWAHIYFEGNLTTLPLPAGRTLADLVTQVRNWRQTFILMTGKKEELLPSVKERVDLKKIALQIERDDQGTLDEGVQSHEL